MRERTAADEQALTALQQQLGEAAAAVAKARQVLEAAQLARRILEERDQAQAALQSLQADVAAIDARVAHVFDEETLDRLFDYAYFTRYVDEIFSRFETNGEKFRQND